MPKRYTFDKQTQKWTLEEIESPVYETPHWLKDKEYPDKQLYDVVWQRSDPFNVYHKRGECFEEFIKYTPSASHTEIVPHICHIGTAVCARVVADNEEEAEKEFNRMLNLYWENWMLQ